MKTTDLSNHFDRLNLDPLCFRSPASIFYCNPHISKSNQQPIYRNLLFFKIVLLLFIILIIHYMDVHREKKVCDFFCFIAHLSGTKTELTNSSFCIHTVSEMVSVMSPL